MLFDSSRIVPDTFSLHLVARATDVPRKAAEYKHLTSSDNDPDPKTHKYLLLKTHRLRYDGVVPDDFRAEVEGWFRRAHPLSDPNDYTVGITCIAETEQIVKKLEIPSVMFDVESVLKDFGSGEHHTELFKATRALGPKISGFRKLIETGLIENEWDGANMALVYLNEVVECYKPDDNDVIGILSCLREVNIPYSVKLPKLIVVAASDHLDELWRATCIATILDSRGKFAACNCSYGHLDLPALMKTILTVKLQIPKASHDRGIGDTVHTWISEYLVPSYKCQNRIASRIEQNVETGLAPVLKNIIKANHLAYGFSSIRDGIPIMFPAQYLQTRVILQDWETETAKLREIMAEYHAKKEEMNAIKKTLLAQLKKIDAANTQGISQ
jgi:hypothetical protein